MSVLKLGKYFEILLSILIFLFLYAAILGLNYFISVEINDDAHAMQLASRQTRLNQQILSELYLVQDQLQTNKHNTLDLIEPSVLSLTQSFRQFDEVLDSFIYGGELIGIGQGQDSLLINTNYAQVNYLLLKEIEKIWRPYRARISPVMYSIYGETFDRTVILEKTSTAISIAQAINPEMLKKLQQFTVSLETLAERKVKKLQAIQGIGIVIAILYFFALMFYFFRKLDKSNLVAEIAKRETEEILTTINEGLFLLDKNFNIGSQHSKALSSMLNIDEPAGANFIELIRPVTSKNTFNTTKEFLSLMFEEHVDASLIQSLNPLTKVEMHISQESGKIASKHYSFQFSPVEEEGKLLHILVSIIDISERIQLETELQESQKKSAQDVELLLSVIQIEPELLAAALHSTEHGLSKINDFLKSSSTEQSQFRKKHRNIARITHKIKGDCTAIEMHTIAELMHEMENELDNITKNTQISGNSFLPITLHLNQAHKQIQLIKEAIEKINVLRKALKKDKKNRQSNKFVSTEQKNSWSDNLSLFSQKIARQYGKDLSVNLEGYCEHSIAPEKVETIRDAIIQFIRNAVVHGIEKPEERIQLGKKPKGTITISSETTSSHELIHIRDDGKGIDLKKIREKLKENSIATDQEIVEMNRAKLVSMLFKHGFSTANNIDMNAGRGVGLDLVKSSIEQSGAKLGLRFKTGVYTQFTLLLPRHLDMGQGL